MDPMSPSPLPPQALDGCGPGIMSGFVEKMNSFTIVQPLQPQIAAAQEQAPGSPEKRQHKAEMRKAKKEQKALARQQKKEEKQKKKEERKAAKAAKLNSKKNSRAHKPALTAE